MTRDHAAALAVLDRITPGKWHAANMVHAERGDRMTPEELGAYVTANVKRSRAEGGSDNFLFVTTEGEDVPDICHVGNGPRGPFHARAIAALPELAALYRAGVEFMDAPQEEHAIALQSLRDALAAVADALTKGEGK